MISTSTHTSPLNATMHLKTASVSIPSIFIRNCRFALTHSVPPCNQEENIQNTQKQPWKRWSGTQGTSNTRSALEHLPSNRWSKWCPSLQTMPRNMQSSFLVISLDTRGQTYKLLPCSTTKRLVWQSTGMTCHVHRSNCFQISSLFCSDLCYLPWQGHPFITLQQPLWGSNITCTCTWASFMCPHQVLCLSKHLWEVSVAMCSVDLQSHVYQLYTVK